MRRILKDVSGVAAAAIVFWLVGVLLLPLVAMVWPANGSSDLPLKPQNIPSMILGFIFALYVFRRVTSPKRNAVSQ